MLGNRKKSFKRGKTRVTKLQSVLVVRSKGYYEFSRPITERGKVVTWF